MSTLEAEREQAQTAQNEAKAREKQAAQQKVIGLCVIGGAVLAGSAGLALHLLALLVGAVVAALGGAVSLVQGTQKAGTARAEVEEAKQKTHSLAGQIKQAQAQIAAYDLEKESRSVREYDSRRHLENLGEPVPADFAAARERIAALPALSHHDAQSLHQNTLKAVHQAEAAHEIAPQQHETESSAVQAYDATASEAKIAALKAERDTLKQILNDLADLPAFLAALGVAENLEAVQEKLRIVRQEVDAGRSGKATGRESSGGYHCPFPYKPQNDSVRGINPHIDVYGPGENRSRFHRTSMELCRDERQSSKGAMFLIPTRSMNQHRHTNRRTGKQNGA